MHIVITDGNERSALAVTRALGRQGILVMVGAESRCSLAGSSKYCNKSFIYPNPYTSPEDFTNCLLENIRKVSASALFPISDIAMQLVGLRKAEFDKSAYVPIPPHRVFEDLSDKYYLMQLATQLGVPIPETLFVSEGRLEDVIDRVPGYPVVVKPSRSVKYNKGVWEKTGVHYAANAEDLSKFYRERSSLQERSLIQQRIVGPGQGLFVLMNQGVPVSVFAHKRLRERPPSGGVSVLRESIEPPKAMTDHALRLLQHVKWHGVAMVEFKQDSRSDRPVLIEVNGRFWGSLQLASDAGVNFPFMLYQMATGRPVGVPANGYRVGVKSRWLLGDLDHLLLRLLKPDGELHLPPGSPSKWRSIVEFCRFIQRDLHYEVERLDDFNPSAYEIRRYVTSLFTGSC